MLKGPVVIGGIGGSGTRVVAEMLTMLGYFIGNDLNSALDNLSYTLLFKRPIWYLKNHHHKEKIMRGLSVLEKSMITRKSHEFRERIFLNKAVRDIAMYGHNKEGEGKGQWAYERLRVFKDTNSPPLDNFTGWGWKEPNTHLLVPVMNDYFHDFKYIHTIRHGLDMAFSFNQQQLYNWGPLFNINPPENEYDVPGASIKYWIKVNNRILNLAEKLGGGKVLIINFDDLCKKPGEGIGRMVEFLQCGLSEIVHDRLLELPVLPSSSGRFKRYPRDIFDASDIKEVEKFGFDCTY
jgi:hypothetical protein